jgi:hypothetical protein
MRQLAGLFVVFLFSISACAQAESRTVWLRSLLNDEEFTKAEQKIRITRFNFAPLWTSTENSSVFGFIGEGFQRLRIKMISVTKEPDRPDTYTVSGKSMVKNVVRAFTGFIKITQARIRTNQHFGIDDEYKNKVRESGIVVGQYHFLENKSETNTGSFDGEFATYWYIDLIGRLRYDDIESGADGYLNNQFVGNWTSYKTRTSKIANWGDYRIPLSGDLDIGAGEFSPDDKYVANGWHSYRDAYTNQNKRAVMEERRRWWQ